MREGFLGVVGWFLCCGLLAALSAARERGWLD